ncbi:NAD(P)-binding domain-containing protein [Gammaproteobacteria bacterium]|nr:NAD(P)-binding domain-containing protein [Gammaproteobacteria bacterium]
MNSSLNIFCITPIKHIEGVQGLLGSIGNLTIIDDPTIKIFKQNISQMNVIFTNPNKSKIFLGKENLHDAKNLQVICTASTGTNHIDKAYCKEMGIKIISLTKELEVISTISSTAEHALALLLSAVRNIKFSSISVDEGQWNYEPFVGRQLNYLTIGIIGYGRLGKMMAKFCKALFKEVLVFDPYVCVTDKGVEQVHSLDDIARNSDVVSLHVHVSHETQNLISKEFLQEAKPNLLIVNTSRGEIVDEEEMVKYLKANPKSKIATDVLKNEITSRNESKLLILSKESNQVLITPHIGGMTSDAQEIAYNHALQMLIEYIDKKKN